MGKMKTMVCGTCGSANVSCDATVRWNIAAQKWSVSGVHEGDYCDDCDQETRIEEEELE